jgi:hypothetical protein
MKYSNWLLIGILVISSYTSYSQVNRVLFDDRKNETDVMSSPNENQTVYLGNQANANVWRITNDGVMGGRSQGYITLNQDHGLFTGNISLDNNGGFSAMFTPIKSLNENVKNVTINIQGDGQTYQLRMIMYINGYRISYNKAVATRKNIRQSITYQLSDFVATFRGRSIPNAPKLTPDKIREIGFLMTKKKAGPFSIAIYEVSFS